MNEKRYVLIIEMSSVCGTKEKMIFNWVASFTGSFLMPKKGQVKRNQTKKEEALDVLSH